MEPAIAGHPLRHCGAGIRRLHVRPHTIATYVHEHLLAMGRTQFLNGGHHIPHLRHGRTAAGVVMALSHAALLLNLPAVRVQRLSADRRIAEHNSPPYLHHTARLRHKAHEKGVL